MSNYSYKTPDPEKYLSAIKLLVKKQAPKEVSDSIQKCRRIFINTTSSFSGQRWNAYSTSIVFYFSPEDWIDLTESQEGQLASICDRLMPKEAGYDVNSVEFSTDLEVMTSEDVDIEKDIADSIDNNVDGDQISEVLGEIKENGLRLSKLYLYLYLTENILRKYIDKKASGAHGVNYFQILNVGRDIKNSIQNRKEQEEKKKWLSLRGDSEVYYLDFKDLGTLIRNNWEIFKPDFPTQDWIAVKIDEMYDCRNLIAHNSNVGKHEAELISLYFKSIVKQLSKKY